MVRKLFKHEFKAWLRVAPIVFGITLAVAGMHRILQFFESDTMYYSIINGSAIFIYVVALLATMATPIIFGITRFYKNMFSGEGYLTLTLPVTPANHLWVKVITAVVFALISLAVCILSAIVITAGDVFTEVCKAGAYLVNMLHKDIAGHLAGYCVEFCLLILVSLFMTYLLYYTCICVGQLFRKNRVLAAVGVYFGVYVVNQILGTILSIVIVILEETGALEGLFRIISAHPYATVHTVLCAMTVLYALLALVYHLICNSIIRKRLNLE